MAAEAKTSVDPDEIARFERLAADWWSPTGSMKPLHRLNPPRLRFIRDAIAAWSGKDGRAADGLAGLSMLDVGCGAGLLCEPLVRLGARVTGLDAAAASLEVARLHAARSGLVIDYRDALAEDLLARGETFDVVLALEVVEHVVDAAAFLKTCAGLTRPGGLMLVSTINRTMKAWALAIVAAERILRWLPPGTHRWDRFVKPAEILAALAPAGMTETAGSGMIYDPLVDEWRLSRDMDVNYIMAFARG
jgi:2-polyprenyl-6-hydroxyphenyl methylase / 3-demethylubiquinone-9 3-methyltransferase